MSDQARLEHPDDHWLEIPHNVLLANREDAVLLLRLGAFADAVQSCFVQLVQRLQEPDSAATDRDRAVLFLASVGYLKEAVDHIQQRQARIRQLLNVARKQGLRIEKWSEIEKLLTAAPGSLYEALLVRVRHDLAFHFKEQVFEEWLSRDNPAQRARIWDNAGGTNAGTWYRASSECLAHDLAKGADLKASKVTLSLVRDAQILLLRLAEAVTFGFIFSVGLTIEECLGRPGGSKSGHAT